MPFHRFPVTMPAALTVHADDPEAQSYMAVVSDAADGRALAHVTTITLRIEAGKPMEATVESYRLVPGADASQVPLDVRQVELPPAVERRRYRITKLDAVLERLADDPVTCMLEYGESPHRTNVDDSSLLAPAGATER